ncbi:podocalyxin [Etheostoma cragini]|uniref:podocalyxin n=1 Tax=Etheostoma cragini TaxID=417921 RepID=UPI00155F5041|nr:podocalyxin [Etheostoma cragini]
MSRPNPADKVISTKTQAPTVPSTTPPPSTTLSAAPPSGGNGASPPSSTPSKPMTPPPATSEKAVSTDSGGGLAQPFDAGALQSTGTPKTSGTPAPVTPPADVSTTKTVTDAATSQPEVPTHIVTIPITTSQDSNRGTETGSGQTSPRATESAGNTGTSSPPPTLTTAGPPAAETTNAGTNAGTTSPPQTTTTTTTFTTTSPTTTINATAAQPKTFLYSLNNGPQKQEDKDLAEVCKRLLVNLQDGNCTLKWQHHDSKVQFDYVEINGKVKTSLASQYYEEIIKKPTDNKTLIAILASCGALLIMIVILAVCASHHRKPYNENQQHLTEELHTVENGYHDNPTLEVMEVQPEMQEKKTALNGEFNDSWIVPIDNLLKEDIAGEEDTHL